MDSGKNSGRYRITAMPVIWIAQLFGAAAIALMLVWVLHFRGGFSLKTNDLARLLNAHHVMMLLGPIICVGQAIMALKMVPGRRKWKKIAHVMLNLKGLAMGVTGLYAIFTVIKKDGTLLNFDSLHSWIGFGTMCLYFLQFLIGFIFFVFPGTTMMMKANLKPWHGFFGLVIFILAVGSAATGIIRRFWFLELRRGSEALVLNFTGVAIILFGITVVLSVVLP